MDKLSEKNKKLIKTCLGLTVFIFVIAIIIILVFRYSIEGERNLPFNLTSIRVISTAEGNSTEVSESAWNVDIIQKNDFYFYFEKNPEYKKEESISKITFENFEFKRASDKGNISIYKPSADSILYYYNDEYKINNNISYNGALSTNLPSLEIGNQGGLIGFSIALTDLGNYTKSDNSDMVYDGTLLSKLNLTMEDISMEVSFDVIIETASNKKFKSTLYFDLPTGNIIEEGRSVLDKNNSKDVIFKRF